MSLLADNRKIHHPIETLLDVNSSIGMENPACSKSPSRVSRENNCVKTEINRGKQIYV